MNNPPIIQYAIIDKNGRIFCNEQTGQMLIFIWEDEAQKTINERKYMRDCKVMSVKIEIMK